MAKAKTDSEKDLLFSKLLPALNDNPFSTVYDGDRENPPEPEAESPDTLSALRNKLFARSNGFSGETYATINVMENLVLKHLDQVMRRFNTCSCDRCRCDVAACALNHLTPKYIVTNPNRMPQIEAEIGTKVVLDALVNAVIQVRSKPRH